MNVDWFIISQSGSTFTGFSERLSVSGDVNKRRVGLAQEVELVTERLLVRSPAPPS